MAQGPGGGFGGGFGGGRPGGRTPRGDMNRRANENTQTQQKRVKTNDKTYTVIAVLQEFESQEPLMFANVALLKRADSSFVRGASSDDRGRVTLTGIPAGEYLLRVSSIGYQNVLVPTDVNCDTNLGTLKIKQGATTLNAVVISEKRPIYSVDGEKNLYNVTDDPSIQTGTTADALQNAPGVEVDIEGNVTLRGVSSVEIWINDRPSRLNEENLKTYLQQLPANALERIEVITNPSARYGTKTDGGVINIVTNANIKKNSFTSFGTHLSTQPSLGPWISYMWANEKWSFNVYSGFRYSDRKNKSDGYDFKLNHDKDTISHEEYDSERDNTSMSGNIFVNASCLIDSMNTITMYGSTNLSKTDNSSSENRMREELLASKKYEYSTTNESDNKSVFGNLGATYEHKFNNFGHKLSVDVSGRLSGSTGNTSFIRTYKVPYEVLSKDKNVTADNSSKSGNIDVDYSLPYSKNGELEFGISGGISSSDGLYSPDTLVFGSDVRNIDSLRFMDTRSTGRELSAYATLRRTFGDFVVKLGVRADYDNVDYQIFNSEIGDVSKDFFNLLPSLHLSYRTESMHTFTLSYSRRVRNPNTTQLSEYVSYSEDSYSYGNPELGSTYTNSFEGGWNKYFESFGSVGVSAYHRNSTDQINTLTRSEYSDVFGRTVMVSSPVNLGASYNTGGEFRIVYRPTAFMNVRFYANLYDSYIEYVQGEDKVLNHKTSYSLRVNFWAKLWDILEVYASGRYKSPTQSLYAESKSTYSIDGGLRADFLKRKISVFVNVQDIFNWNKSENTTSNPYYISYSSQKVTNSRFISAGVTFRFGKMELEKRAKMGGEGGGDSEE